VLVAPARSGGPELPDHPTPYLLLDLDVPLGRSVRSTRRQCR
jgi:hypothetical protein